MKLFYSNVITILTSIFILAGNCNAEISQKKIKIGISTALTGAAANYGLDLRDAVMFANEKFGEGKYQLIFEDDKCNGLEAVTIANKFINLDKVDYVLGFVCSGAALAALPIYDKAKIPVMITSASSARIRDAGENVFRTAPSDLEAGKLLFSHISKKHKRIGIISEETDYAQDLKNAFLLDNKDRQLELIERNYLPELTDFRTMLLQLKQANVEAVFINSQTESSAILIVKQLSDVKLSVPLYGAYFPGSPVFIEQLGKLAEGIEFVDPPSPKNVLTSDGIKTMAEYQTSYQAVRSIESTVYTTYEGFRVLDLTVESGINYKDFLLSEKFSGIFGNFSFDAKGELIGLNFKIKKIQNGTTVELY
jgi:branched-chain amino acid transport system substrate-binding protein